MDSSTKPLDLGQYHGLNLDQHLQIILDGYKEDNLVDVQAAIMGCFREKKPNVNKPELIQALILFKRAWWRLWSTNRSKV